MARPFRFGVTAASAPSRTAWVNIARRAEELGYSTLLIPDRTSVGILAPVPALAVAASVTTSLRVGSYVFCNGYHHPVLLAREAATLDLLTDGRFELGLGTGVSSTEFEQMGLELAFCGWNLMYPITSKRTMNGAASIQASLHTLVKAAPRVFSPMSRMRRAASARS